MKKEIFKIGLIIATIGNVYAEIIPAKKAKEISSISTKKVIENFMKNPTTKKAYEEVENYINNLIKKTAKEGFYDTINIKINNIGTKTKNMKFIKLTKKQKDILKYLIKKQLIQSGYKVKKGEYDILGIDWWVTWK